MDSSFPKGNVSVHGVTKDAPSISGEPARESSPIKFDCYTTVFRYSLFPVTFMRSRHHVRATGGVTIAVMS